MCTNDRFSLVTAKASCPAVPSSTIDRSRPGADISIRKKHLNKIALLLFFSGFAHAQPVLLPEVDDAKIEYKSPSEALAALRIKPGVEISVQRNWTIAVEPERHVIWSFAPEQHPAYPAVVKRTFVQKDGIASERMQVKCRASKSACDALVREFLQLAEETRKALQATSNKAN